MMGMKMRSSGIMICIYFIQLIYAETIFLLGLFWYRNNVGKLLLIRITQNTLREWCY